MKRKIGIIIDSLRLGARDGIRKAKELGADGFQIYCTGGEMAPENLSKAARRELREFVSGLGLEISALCGDIGKGFLDRSSNPEVTKRTREFVDLAVDLGTRVVTSHIGHLPEDESHEYWQTGAEALSELGSYAESRGCVIAMETGPEEPALLRRFLDRIGGKGLGVNYDPANLVMCGPFDHLGGVEILKDYIVHTHAKDGVCLKSFRSAKGGAWDWNNMKILEVPLGEGGVAFKHYLKALDDIGYKGYLTIEREVGDDPARDVGAAVKFLRSFETRQARASRPARKT